MKTPLAYEWVRYASHHAHTKGPLRADNAQDRPLRHSARLDATSHCLEASPKHSDR